MRLYKLDDKVFTVKGNAAGFMKGISSNTLDAPLNAFLNQHGRIIATFRQRKLSDDEIWISVPDIAAQTLLGHLERYAKLSHTAILPGDLRSYMDTDTLQTVWDADEHPNALGEQQFTLLRLEQGIPLMGVDYHADEFILNVHELDYVSYVKGCFLGQEPVAKVHNRSVPSRRLQVLFEDQCSVQEAAAMTSKAKDPSSGRTKGFIFVRTKPQGEGAIGGGKQV